MQRRFHKAFGRNLSRRSLCLLAAVASLTTVLCPRATEASEGEHAFAGGLRYVFQQRSEEAGGDTHGAGVSVEYRYAASDFFAVVIAADYAISPGDAGSRAHVGNVRGGLAYTIDAVAWVPWVAATIGLYAAPQLDPPVDAGLALGIGLDYRPARGYALGAEIWYHGLTNHFGEIPAMIAAGFKATWYMD